VSSSHASAPRAQTSAAGGGGGAPSSAQPPPPPSPSSASAAPQSAASLHSAGTAISGSGSSRAHRYPLAPRPGRALAAKLAIVASVCWAQECLAIGVARTYLLRAAATAGATAALGGAGWRRGRRRGRGRSRWRRHCARRPAGPAHTTATQRTARTQRRRRVGGCRQIDYRPRLTLGAGGGEASMDARQHGTRRKRTAPYRRRRAQQRRPPPGPPPAAACLPEANHRVSQVQAVPIESLCIRCLGTATHCLGTATQSRAATIPTGTTNAGHRTSLAYCQDTHSMTGTNPPTRDSLIITKRTLLFHNKNTDKSQSQRPHTMRGASAKQHRPVPELRVHTTSQRQQVRQPRNGACWRGLITRSVGSSCAGTPAACGHRATHIRVTCRRRLSQNVGKSQPVLVIITPMIFTRTRMPATAKLGAL
jgi:hypothetical protein